MNEVTLQVDSREFGGWTGVRISQSLNNACSDFELSCALGDDETFSVRPDAPCRILVDGELILTGNLDGWSDVDTKDGGRILTVPGRSKTADLVDCAAPHKPGEWNNRKLEDIARALAAEYGVDVIVEGSTGAKIERHVIEVGETVHQSVSRLAAMRGFLVTDNPQGNYVLTHAGSDTIDGRIKRGVTGIKRGGLVLQTGQLYSDYVCKGQRGGNDNDYGATVSEGGALVQLAVLQRKRTTIITPEHEADRERCRLRATWEACTRLGQAISLEYELEGWRTESGALWTINKMVPIEDLKRGVDGRFLIHTVTRGKEKTAGTTCIVSAQPREAFAPELPAQPTQGIKAWEELRGGVSVP